MDNNFALHNSGQRRDFGTGSVRDVDTNKPRIDFLSPYALERFGHHMAKGAAKYGEFNWQLGQPVSQFIASLERHLNAYKRGLNDEDHLAAIVYGAQAIMHFEELAKLGDATALRMLDRYASKAVAEQIERERFMVEFSLEPFAPKVEAPTLNRDWVGKTVRVVRDVIADEYQWESGDEVILAAGTPIEVENIDDLNVNVLNFNGIGYYEGRDLQTNQWFGWIDPRWVELYVEPEKFKCDPEWVGKTVRVVRDVYEREYGDTDYPDTWSDEDEIRLTEGTLLKIDTIDRASTESTEYYECYDLIHTSLWYGWVQPQWVEIYVESYVPFNRSIVNEAFIGRQVRFVRDVSMCEYSNFRPVDTGEIRFHKGDVYTIEGIERHNNRPPTYKLSPYTNRLGDVNPLFVKPEWVEIIYKVGDKVVANQDITWGSITTSDDSELLVPLGTKGVVNHVSGKMDLVRFEGLEDTWYINKYQLDPVI